MELTKAQAFVLIVTSVSVAIELRTVVEFSSVKLPLVVAAIIEPLFLALLFVSYGLYGKRFESTAQPTTRCSFDT